MKLIKLSQNVLALSEEIENGAVVTITSPNSTTEVVLKYKYDVRRIFVTIPDEVKKYPVVMNTIAHLVGLHKSHLSVENLKIKNIWGFEVIVNEE